MAVKQPVVQTIASVKEGTPAVVQVSFDLWTLRITMQFPGISTPTYVEFENVSGFRVLDEGDLLEFWSPEVRKPGWLWLVEAGGWLHLESTRDGFLRGDLLAMKEFMVLGINECVNVFAPSEPRVYGPEL